MENKLNVLLISSESLSRRSSRLALDQYLALKACGHEVDVLTKYDNSGNPDIIAVCGPEPVKKRLSDRIRRKLDRIFRPVPKPNKYYFFYTDELRPPVSVRKVLAKINKPYDLILVSFWQGLLSARTVFEIFRKTGCPVMFFAVDMSPMTGGCHYFWDCTRYQQECGCCPAIGSESPDDFTHFNIMYRREKFAGMRCAFLGNSYINGFARKSTALQGVLIERSTVIVNEKEFAPSDKNEMRRQLGVAENKKFILFSGAEWLADSRKGMKFLIESLNRFYDTLTEKERGEILLLLAGNTTPQLSESIKMESRSLGFIEFEQLPRIYSAADVFLCPSIQDAGPMMVNQSLSCGTPVVAFEMGTALDVIKGHDTGYCARLGDADDFTRGIEYIYRLDDIRRAQISENCRAMALRTSSYESFCRNTVRIYRKLTEGMTK